MIFFFFFFINFCLLQTDEISKIKVSAFNYNSFIKNEKFNELFDGFGCSYYRNIGDEKIIALDNLCQIVLKINDKFELLYPVLDSNYTKFKKHKKQKILFYKNNRYKIRVDITQSFIKNQTPQNCSEESENYSIGYFLIEDLLGNIHKEIFYVYCGG